MWAKRLLEGLRFAAEKHRHHRRKDVDESPYINHPISVAAILAVEGGLSDEDTLLAALLHDTVEDTDATFEEIEALFGSVVTELVRELTDDKTLPNRERKRLQVVHARTASDLAKQLKIADKVSNIRDITDAPPMGWSTERRLEYFGWAEKVVAGCRGVNTNLEATFDAAVARARAALDR